MALTKQVKIGGSYYKGHKFTIGAGAGDTVCDMTITSACVINGITVVPDVYGAGDHFKLEHIASDNTTVLSTLAESVYNIGANAAWQFDFAALERCAAGEKFKLTYTSVAGLALNLYTCVERIK